MKFYHSREKKRVRVKEKFSFRAPRTKKEEQEFGAGKTDILVCKICGVFYWYKSWHHNLANYPRLNESKQVKFTLCPACQMIKNKKFEGEIILKNVLPNLKKEILALVKNYGERAVKKDPMNRIISVKESKIKRSGAKGGRGGVLGKAIAESVNIRILATENQLARRLAKKINEICGRKFFVAIADSNREDVARITIDFAQK